MMKRCVSLAAAVMVLLVLSSCGSESVRRQLFMMDTSVLIDIRGPGAEAALSEIEEKLIELDRDLSAYREDGELYRINEGESSHAGTHVIEILEDSVEYCRSTGGKFSPLLGTVIDLWGVGSKNYIPTADEISRALACSHIENLVISDGQVELRGGARINLGAIAKGYASDVVRECLVEYDIPRAVISLGGNVYVRGTREDGQPWSVAIRDPRGGEADYLGIVALSDKFVISSGDYERYFERDGVRYHHIMDPETGAPAESDLMAAVVISDCGALGDAYSTAAYVMGREQALEFWRNMRGFDLILVGRDGRVTVTEGIAESFKLSENAGYTYEVAHR